MKDLLSPPVSMHKFLKLIKPPPHPNKQSQVTKECKRVLPNHNTIPVFTGPYS